MLIELKISPLARDLINTGKSILDLLKAIADDVDGDIETVLTHADWPHPADPPKKEMKAVLALTPAQRRQLLDAVQHDLSFESNIGEEEFRFEFSDLPAQVYKAGKALLGSL